MYNILIYIVKLCKFCLKATPSFSSKTNIYLNSKACLLQLAQIATQIAIAIIKNTLLALDIC